MLATAPSESSLAALRPGPIVYSAASRERRSSGTQKPVSVIPSGPKIRLAKNSSSPEPEATSTTRPSTSVATE